VWNSPQANARLKKRIVRTLMKEVVVDIDEARSEVVLTIHWQGGLHTELRVARRRRGTTTRTAPDILAAVRILAHVLVDEMIASFLNRNNLKTGRGNRWTKERINSLRSYHQIPCYSSENKEREGWMTLTEAAEFLHLSSRTVRLAVERGEIPSEHPLADGPWVFRRADLARDFSCPGACAPGTKPQQTNRGTWCWAERTRIFKDTEQRSIVMRSCSSQNNLVECAATVLH
jgi:hypothetical protein